MDQDSPVGRGKILKSKYLIGFSNWGGTIKISEPMIFPRNPRRKTTKYVNSIRDISVLRDLIFWMH